MLKSLLGNEMLYNSWVNVLHITYFWSPTIIIYWKPPVTYHFDLFVINKDDNQHVFQSCTGLVNMEPFMANHIIIIHNFVASHCCINFHIHLHRVTSLQLHKVTLIIIIIIIIITIIIIIITISKFSNLIGHQQAWFQP